MTDVRLRKFKPAQRQCVCGPHPSASMWETCLLAHRVSLC
jgi:hypothetical protein